LHFPGSCRLEADHSRSGRTLPSAER